MRSHFDEQLAELNRELIAMGALCEEAIAIAAKALMTGDTCLAAKVFARSTVRSTTWSAGSSRCAWSRSSSSSRSRKT